MQKSRLAHLQRDHSTMASLIETIDKEKDFNNDKQPLSKTWIRLFRDEFPYTGTKNSQYSISGLGHLTETILPYGIHVLYMIVVHTIYLVSNWLPSTLRDVPRRRTRLNTQKKPHHTAFIYIFV